MADPRGTDTDGLELEALRGYLDEHCPGLIDGELSKTLIAGGKSNLTYAVTGGATTVIVRRPPLGHVLATAHDMAREHRVMSALQGTTVPVPQTYSLCEDADVIGAPFYVMAKAEGTPYRLATELEPLGPERTREISARMIDVLADLHSVDPESVGLADFGRPEGFLARQVKRWGQQLDASHSRDLAGADELRARLAERVPEKEQPAAIVHGDYRLDNLLVDDDDTVTAVLDWEMATLGDPLTDVALMTVYQDLARLKVSPELVSDVSEAPGYLSVPELLARYGERSGRDLTHLGFYRGLAYFKLAVILEGIHYRYSQGKTLGEGFAHIGQMTEPLLAAGLAALEED